MTVLGIVFIILKINNVIDWSWVWVLAPLFVAVIWNSIYSSLLQLSKQAKQK